MMTAAKTAFLAATAPREETVEVSGLKILVRELESAAHSERLKEAADAIYAFMVLSCFDPETQERLFAEDDIPALKTRSRKAMTPLIDAVARVNGFDAEIEEKNSVAGPAAG